MEQEQTTATALPFLPQEPSSIGSQLHRHLRTTIIRGELRPGQAISETETSKQYALSRQPVREAFIKLAEERLVDVLPQRGTYVRKISVKEVLDARYVREVIEVAIARDLAASGDTALVQRLEEVILRQEQVSQGDKPGFLALDEEFHRTMALSAGREYAWRVVESIKAQMDRVRYLSFDEETPIPRLVCQHGDIVAAIAAADPDRAAKVVSLHLREIEKALPLIAARYPSFFTD